MQGTSNVWGALPEDLKVVILGHKPTLECLQYSSVCTRMNNYLNNQGFWQSKLLGLFEDNGTGLSLRSQFIMRAKRECKDIEKFITTTNSYNILYKDSLKLISQLAMLNHAFKMHTNSNNLFSIIPKNLDCLANPESVIELATSQKGMSEQLAALIHKDLWANRQFIDTLYRDGLIDEKLLIDNISPTLFSDTDVLLDIINAYNLDVFHILNMYQSFILPWTWSEDLVLKIIDKTGCFKILFFMREMQTKSFFDKLIERYPSSLLKIIPCMFGRILDEAYIKKLMEHPNFSWENFTMPLRQLDYKDYAGSHIHTKFFYSEEFVERLIDDPIINRDLILVKLADADLNDNKEFIFKLSDSKLFLTYASKAIQNNPRFIMLYLLKHGMSGPYDAKNNQLFLEHSKDVEPLNKEQRELCLKQVIEAIQEELA